MKTIEELMEELPTYHYLAKKKVYDAVVWCLETRRLDQTMPLIEQEYGESLHNFLTRCLIFLKQTNI